MPSNFWYLLKSFGFIQNCHVTIEAKTMQKVLYSPSFRNNHPPCPVASIFRQKQIISEKFGKSGFSKSRFFKNLYTSKK